MCFSSEKAKDHNVYSVHNSHGEITEQSNTYDVPEHVDNPYMNRHVQYGILGFRYETKNETFIVYSSVEAKTFCILMSLSPMQKSS